MTAHKHRTAPRRPSVTEAKRRTSLDDDDEDGVVHIDHAVGSQLSPLSPPILGYGKPGASPSARIVDENDEMVEIGHTEPSTHQPVSEK